MKFLRIGIFLFLTILIPVCTPALESGLKKATLIPQWVPQAQFAGYYMALEKGFYKNHGIDLTIITGGPDSPPVDLLRDGIADFATFWLTSGLEARDKNIPVINIAQTMQRSSLMLVAKKARGVREPRDMDGKKVGL